MTAITAPLHRTKRVQKTAFADAPLRAPMRRPLRIARQLALAHTMQARIDSGEVRDRSELARLLGVSKARVTQMLDLLLLAPDLQEELLVREVSAGRDPMSEHGVRTIVRLMDWREQRERWRSVLSDKASSGTFAKALGS